MNEELRDKIAKLPVWAREHIKHLDSMPEVLLAEAIKLRKQVDSLEKSRRVLQDRVNAMVEMFQCAAKGGNEVAIAVEKIVDSWIFNEE